MTTPKALSVGFSLRSLRRVRARDCVVRFAFGATMSAVAAVVAIVVGPRFGGLLLAFPAILPATLTLIEREERRKIEREERRNKAKDDDVGAILGATALVPFGALAWLLLPRAGAALALLAAAGGWLVCAVSLYLVLRLAVGHWRS